MRNAWTTKVAAITIFLLALGACASSEPDRSVSRTASLQVAARAQYFLFECWDIFQVQPDSSEVDTGFDVCDQLVTQEIRPVPWRYTLSISVIHAGTTTEQIVTSIDGRPGSSVDPGNSVPDYISMTDFDPVAVRLSDGQRPPDGDLVFRNGNRVSVGSPIYLNALHYQVPGPPNVLGASPSFDFTVSSGDTIIVRARKQALADSPGFLVGEQVSPSLFLTATLLVGGSPIIPSGGISKTDFADRSGFTFSYTVP